MSQVKRVEIKSYDTTDNEDTNLKVWLLPAVGTNNNERVDIIIEQITPAISLQVSVKYNELMLALGVVKK